MKTETRFTPGPWLIDGTTIYTPAKDGGNRFQAYFTRGFDDNGQRIENSEVVANAVLAQAAPDMYAALQSAREYVGECLSLRRVMFAGHEDIGSVSDIEACIAQIDETLAKADDR